MDAQPSPQCAAGSPGVGSAEAVQGCESHRRGWGVDLELLFVITGG